VVIKKNATFYKKIENGAPMTYLADIL